MSPTLIEACWHELLRLFGQPVDPTARINLTFYPYQNFVASRTQLRTHAHDRYQRAYARLVINGTCLNPPTQLGPHGESVHDSVAVSKETVAKGMEHLMHVIFGGRPLDVDVTNTDTERFVWLPSNQSCTASTRVPNPACVHGL